MLDEKRVKEAERNVRSYLDEGLLKKIKEIDRDIINVFKKNAEESLGVADLLFRNNISPLWVAVSSYYAMYYSANAVLCKSGYKVGHKISHKVTSDALIALVRNKLKEKFLEDFEEARDEALESAEIKADDIITSFDFERRKRSSFQYDMTKIAKKNKAQTSLERAKKFAFEMEKLLIK